MPIKAYGRGDDPAVHRWPGGLSWVAHPEEAMRRASHALVVDAETGRVDDTHEAADPAVWLVEPLDVAGLDDLLAELGPVAGVVVLAGLHSRDAGSVARRHGVAVHLPATVAGAKARVDGPVEVFEGTLPGTALRAIPVLDGVPWSEAVLYDEGSGTLVATEVLVTSARTTGPGERLSVGPYARLQPPRAELGGLAVDRVLVGHGAPLLDDAGAALDRALATARQGLPRYLAKDLVYMLRAGYVALRD